MPDRPAPLLLDTCAVIWVAEDQAISEAAALALNQAHAADQFIYVSPISHRAIRPIASLRRQRASTAIL
jgi:PIN domain nuclease of toxin-antitoxin system